MKRAQTKKLHFDTVALGGRKSCPACDAKLNGEPILAWYEYQRARKYLVSYFCRECSGRVSDTIFRVYPPPQRVEFSCVWHGGHTTPQWIEDVVARVNDTLQPKGSAE